MNDKLRKLANCLPEWMQAYPVGNGLNFGAVHSSYWLNDNPGKFDAQLDLSKSDIDNATGIIALLDAMEKAGELYVLLSSTPTIGNPPKYELIVFRQNSENEPIKGEGLSKTEAIVDAALAVFGGDGAKGGGA